MPKLRKLGARIASPVWVNLAVLLFCLTLAFHRVDPINQLPDDRDSLEVLGIIGCLCNDFSPNLALNYFPTGYPLVIYAQLGAVLGLLPLCRLVPGPLLLNGANIASHAAAFYGVLKLAGTLGVPAAPALIVAVGYAFSPFRLAVEGHYHVLFGSALLPWAVFFTARLTRPGKGAGRTGPLAAGLAWAATVLLHSYFVWVWALVGVAAAWANRPAWGRLLTSAAVSLLLVGPYAFGLAATLGGGFWQSLGGPEYLFQGGVSPDFLVLPSPFNPLLGRLAADYIQPGRPPRTEGQLGSLGPAVWILLIVGLSRHRVWRREHLALLAAGCVLLVLGLGPLAMVKGQVLSAGLFRPVNEALWGMGRLLKPETFGERPPDWVRDGLPLPGFLWLVLVPFSENVRAAARLVIPAGLLLGLAAGRVFTTMPCRSGLVLGLFWAATVLPGPATWVPVPEAHPVYAWLAARKAGGAILAVGGHGPVTRAPHLWQTLTLGIPTVNGYASYQPAYYDALWRGLAESDLAFADTVKFLAGLGVRFLLVEVGDDVDRLMYARARRSVDLEFVRCFEPADRRWWQQPVCAFEVRPVLAEDRRFDILFDRGWLIREEWGRWAVAQEATGFFWWPGGRARLEFDAFPNCLPGEAQTLELWLNGRIVLRHRFEGCRPSTVTANLTSDVLSSGWNRLTLKFGYARPAAGAVQPLAAGVTRLRLLTVGADSG